MPEALSPCKYGAGLCPAFAKAGTLYCTVHQPEAILQRAEAIVRNNFDPAIAAGHISRAQAVKLRDDIIFQLKESA
jgi:hypothetical protein